MGSKIKDVTREGGRRRGESSPRLKNSPLNPNKTYHPLPPPPPKNIGPTLFQNYRI